MGINLIQASFVELWLLVLKRIVYLMAKLISFKGLAFAVACIFLENGVISGAVWCSLVFGIITNRTGKQIMANLSKGDEGDEKTEFIADSSDISASKLVFKSKSESTRSTANAKQRIREILSKPAN